MLGSCLSGASFKICSVWYGILIPHPSGWNSGFWIISWLSVTMLEVEFMVRLYISPSHPLYWFFFLFFQCVGVAYLIFVFFQRKSFQIICRFFCVSIREGEFRIFLLHILNQSHYYYYYWKTICPSILFLL